MINLSSTTYSFAGGIAHDKSFFTHRICVMELKINVQYLCKMSNGHLNFQWTFQLVHWTNGHFDVQWTFLFVQWTNGHIFMSNGHFCPVTGRMDI